eukprot:scaffold662306_cov60-Prasinocladus_malaysianus.AAC.1
MKFLSCGRPISKYCRNEFLPQVPSKSFPMHADLDDMAAVISHIQQRYPGAYIVGVGFSLGSNLLLRYLGVERENSGLLAAVSVANGYDL